MYLWPFRITRVEVVWQVCVQERGERAGPLSVGAMGGWNCPSGRQHRGRILERAQRGEK